MGILIKASRDPKDPAVVQASGSRPRVGLGRVRASASRRVVSELGSCGVQGRPYVPTCPGWHIVPIVPTKYTHLLGECPVQTPIVVLVATDPGWYIASPETESTAQHTVYGVLNLPSRGVLISLDWRLTDLEYEVPQ